jgi:hypothetical protein
MERRGCGWTDVHAKLVERLLEAGTDERRRALRDSEMRRLRRSAA